MTLENSSTNFAEWLSLHVNFAARKSSLKNVSESSESGQPYCTEWINSYVPNNLTVNTLN